MKKTLALLLALSLVFALSACGSENPLSSIEGANDNQLAGIQAVIDECGITVSSCEPVILESTGDEVADSVAAALSESFAPYTLTAEDGTQYRMTISVEDMTVFSITDPDGNFVYGGLSGLFGN